MAEGNKLITAMDILKAIERDVNEGSFDKELYRNDIALLKGQMNELSLLRNTLGQLKEQLPQYAEHVDMMQAQIEEMEDDVEEMVDYEVEKAVRANDNFNNLMDMINGREPSQKRNRLNKENKTNDAPPILENEKNINKPSDKESNDKPKVVRGVLLEELLKLVDQQWVTEADFEKLPKTMGIEELGAKIFILTKVVDLIRSMPEEMFANDDTKQNMISAAQESLDGFVEQEAEEEMDGIVEMEQGYGIVGEVTAELGLEGQGAGNGKSA